MFIFTISICVSYELTFLVLFASSILVNFVLLFSESNTIEDSTEKLHVQIYWTLIFIISGLITYYVLYEAFVVLLLITGIICIILNECFRQDVEKIFKEHTRLFKAFSLILLIISLILFYFILPKVLQHWYIIPFLIFIYNTVILLIGAYSKINFKRIFGDYALFAKQIFHLIIIVTIILFLYLFSVLW